MYTRTFATTAFAATLAFTGMTGADQGMAHVDPHRETFPHIGSHEKGPNHRRRVARPNDGPLANDQTPARPVIPGFDDQKRGGEIVIVPPPEGPFGENPGADVPGLDDQASRRVPGDREPAGAMAPPIGDSRADITGDGRIDFRDLVAMLSAWGGPYRNNAADLNDDFFVDVRDLVSLLSQMPRIGADRPERPPTERSFLRPGGPQLIGFGDKPVALPPHTPRGPQAPGTGVNNP